MPKTTKWTGTTDGDISDWTNWDNGLPAAGDDAIVPETSTVAMSISMASMDTVAAATGTLTLTGNAVNLETVTIDATVYEWKDTLVDAFDVKIGTSKEASLENLDKAINLSGTAGTHYGTGTTRHPSVTSSIDDSDTAKLLATAQVLGASGDSIATTETMTNGSWGGATLSGGTSATNLALIFVGEGFDEDIGASGSEWRVDATRIVHMGGGTFHHAGIVTNLVVESLNTTKAFSMVTGTVTRFGIVQGAVEHLGGTILTLIMLNSINASFDGSSSTGNTTTIHMAGGVLTSKAALTTLWISGGSLTYTGTNDPQDLNLFGGRVIWNAVDGNNITGVSLWDGEIDFTQAAGKRQITSLIHGNGTIKKSDDLVTILTTINLFGDR